MASGKMHDDEVPTDVSLVRRLLAAQFPQWVDLPIEPVPSAGTDNTLFRLGDAMAVRLPRIHWAVGQVQQEQKWLPKLAPHLPFAIPIPLAMGTPAEGYPWNWSVYRWLEGENPDLARITNLDQLATDLAQFIRALQRIDTTGGPLAGENAFARGVPLAVRDEYTRKAIASLEGIVDTEAVTAAWDESVQAAAWDHPPAWLHGDLQSGNLLVAQGRLSAVIDFGMMLVGDPACDLMVAWNFFTADTRDTFRAAMQVDDATWLRGRGWALSVALVALPYYLHTNPGLVRISRYAIAEVLTDYGGKA